MTCLVLGSVSTSATPPRLALATWPRALRPACTSWGRGLGTERLLSDELHLIVDECVRLRGELRLHNLERIRRQILLQYVTNRRSGGTSGRQIEYLQCNPATYAPWNASRIDDYGLEDP